MNLSIEEKYNAVVLKLKGKLMGGPFAEEMNVTLHRLIDEDKKKVVVDLSGVNIVNSSGLGILIGGFTTMKNGGGTFKMAAQPEKLKGLLSITKLNQVFDHYDTVDAALNSFK